IADAHVSRYVVLLSAAVLIPLRALVGLVDGLRTAAQHPVAKIGLVGEDALLDELWTAIRDGKDVPYSLVFAASRTPAVPADRFDNRRVHRGSLEELRTLCSKFEIDEV